MNLTSFGRYLREYREAHDLSQQELASILGTTKQVLSRYETGQRDPKLSTAAEYAEKLNLPISYFWGEQSASPEKEEDLTPFEREVLSMLRLLSAEQQQAFLSLLKTLPDSPAP